MFIPSVEISPKIGANKEKFRSVRNGGVEFRLFKKSHSHKFLRTRTQNRKQDAFYDKKNNFDMTLKTFKITLDDFLYCKNLI